MNFWNERAGWMGATEVVPACSKAYFRDMVMMAVRDIVQPMRRETLSNSIPFQFK